jgi:hypothetical protein
MAQVILFGGGDGGGFYIDANGRLHKIPPYDPSAVALVRSFGYLVRAESLARGATAKKEVSALADAVQGAVYAHIEKSVGSGAAQGTIVSVSDEGDGFCGTPTGRHHIGPQPRGQIAALEGVTASAVN